MIELYKLYHDDREYSLLYIPYEIKKDLVHTVNLSFSKGALGFLTTTIKIDFFEYSTMLAPEHMYLKVIRYIFLQLILYTFE
jgi:hypothetical protein